MTNMVVNLHASPVVPEKTVPPVLETVSLQKSFGSFHLQDISLSVSPGSIVGLIGRNGAGKSTLLKTCMGVVQKDGGIIRFGGVDIGHTGLPREEVGFVAENHPLYDSMQVKEFIRFCATFYDSWDWHYCQDLQNSFRIAPNKQIRDLSHGTRTKLALIVALAFRPRLLLLDEPTTGLDPAVRREFLLELQTCVETNGGHQSVIFSSHFLEDIETIADQVFVMREGALSSYSSLSDLPKAWSVAYVEGTTRQVGAMLRNLSATLSASSSRTNSKVLIYQSDIPILLNRCAEAGLPVSDLREPTVQEVFTGMV